MNCTDVVLTDGVTNAQQYEDFCPVLDGVLVRKLNDAEAQIGGIVIPDSYQKESGKAVVVAAGRLFSLGGQVFQMADFVKPGDIVVVGEYSPERFLRGNDDLYLVRIHEIKGIARKK